MEIDRADIAKRVAERLGATDDEPDKNSLERGEFRIPDVVGVCPGWRAWGVKADTKKYEVPLLHSVTFSVYAWKPRQIQRARCITIDGDDRRVDSDHVPPNDACGCGLYSAKTLEHLQSMAYHEYDAEREGMFHVVGEVANWGKVVEGTQGWRAEKSYPTAIYVPYEAWHLAMPLQEAYGVPVRLMNHLAPLAPGGKIDDKE